MNKALLSYKRKLLYQKINTIICLQISLRKTQGQTGLFLNGVLYRTKKVFFYNILKGNRFVSVKNSTEYYDKVHT